MTRKISQSIIDLYDAYTHGAMARRDFMKRLAKAAGGAAAAQAIMPLLANDYARASIIAEDDPRLAVSSESFETGDIVDLADPSSFTGEISHAVEAYVARPKDMEAAPAIIVIHENRGLNPHIKDVARRVALEGFTAYAVDMLSPYGGTPTNEDEARSMIGRLDGAKTAQKLAVIAEKLAKSGTPLAKVGAVGFCWGGGMVNALACAAPDLAAGVAYYGMQPPQSEAAKIKAALLLHYAGEDARINAGIPAYETALKAAGVDYALYTYEGVQHAFNNDTNEARYNKDAADLAWSRTIAFFKEKLG